MICSYCNIPLDDINYDYLNFDHGRLRFCGGECLYNFIEASKIRCGLEKDTYDHVREIGDWIEKYNKFKK